MLKKKIAVWFLLPLFLVGCCGKEKKNFVGYQNIETMGKLTPELLWKLGRVSKPVLSPDGTQMVFTITYYNIEEDKGYRDLYIQSTTGGEIRQLTHTAESEFAPQWRPDGKRIAFLLNDGKATNIWEIEPTGKGKRQVSRTKEDLSGFLYSPDGKKLLYIQRVKLDSSVQDLYPDLPKSKARLETQFMYRHWAEWHDYKYNHLFVASYDDGNLCDVKDIMEGERYHAPNMPFDGIEQVAWHPSGKELVYSSKKKGGLDYTLSTNTDLYLYHLDKGETTNLTEGMNGYDKTPLFSSDGSQLAWVSMEQDGYESDKHRLYVMDWATKEKRDYTEEFDFNADNLSWSRDNKRLFFVSNHYGTNELFCLTLANKEIKKLTEGVHNYLSVAESSKGNLIATQQSMSYPTEIYSVNPKDGKAHAVSSINKSIMGEIDMGKVEKRWIKTTDGQDMLTWIIYPPHFDMKKKYPTLLYCQGGPQSTVSQFFSYRWNFQLMAAKDYIIVAPNRRGLPGFGTKWNEQISRDYGGQNMKDYFSAIDSLAKEPYVDADRLGAIGASYGGFSVFWLAGNHQNRFKAFVSHCGIFNSDMMYTSTEEMWFVNWDMGTPQWFEPSSPIKYDFSPHLFVQNWNTPILVITGEKDYRIPYTQSLAAFNSALLKKVPAEFLCFPDEGHWVLKPQNGLLWHRTFFRFLDKWLKP